MISFGKVRFWTLLLGLLTMSGPPPLQAATPVDVVIKSKLGNVTFPHRVHEKIVANCETCHHMGVAAGGCIRCHNTHPDAPRAKDALHRLCKGCHAEKKGPSGCKDCHKK